MGFPTEHDHFGVFLRVQVPPFKETPIWTRKVLAGGVQCRMQPLRLLSVLDPSGMLIFLLELAAGAIARRLNYHGPWMKDTCCKDERCLDVLNMSSMF